MRLAPHQFPGTVLAGVLAADLVSPIVLGNPPLQVIGVAGVKAARGVFDDVCPKCRKIGSPYVPVLEPARRGGSPEPEVYFRIVHVALDAANGTPAYREQTVEIALGPKGAFENGNIGSITRRVPAEQVVNALPPRVRKRKPPKEPKTPQVVILLRKAIAWRALLDSGEASSQADIARREGVTRARVTQVLGLLRLAPEIQERILALPPTAERPSVSERILRPLTRADDFEKQLAVYERVTSAPLPRG